MIALSPERISAPEPESSNGGLAATRRDLIKRPAAAEYVGHVQHDGPHTRPVPRLTREIVREARPWTTRLKTRTANSSRSSSAPALPFPPKQTTRTSGKLSRRAASAPTSATASQLSPRFLPRSCPATSRRSWSGASSSTPSTRATSKKQATSRGARAARMY